MSPSAVSIISQVSLAISAAQACLKLQQDYDAISIRVSCRLGEEQEVFDCSIRKNFGLLASHSSPSF